MEPEGLNGRFTGSNFALDSLKSPGLSGFRPLRTTFRAANMADEQNFSSAIP